jgi:hypothetical protein
MSIFLFHKSFLLNMSAPVLMRPGREAQAAASGASQAS